jgi:23S rRNA pseudouridine1911/1915/1917 synthase
MIDKLQLEAVITDDLSGKRLDQALAIVFSEHSRSRLQQWIKNGTVLVNNRILRQRDQVYSGDRISINTELPAETTCNAEKIPLTVIYEDEELIILNKPAGMVVHPGAGNREHTLLNALLHYDPVLNRIPRAGIVQRLDKDTTGIMVVARTEESHTYLVRQLKRRMIKREYMALATGVMTSGGKIDQPIGRHPVHRTRMAVVEKGKPSMTHYRIIKKYPAHTLIRVQLETGRTHQIRVHMAYIHHPIAGDPVYGGQGKSPRGVSENICTAVKALRRQALHACFLGLTHRVTGESCNWEAPLPDDFQSLLQLLDNEK